MKIRWTQGSVRFRISPRELQTLQQAGTVKERLQLSETGGWAAEISAGAHETSVRTQGESLQVSLSSAHVARLAEPDREGVYFTADANGAEFKYYIEKDFPCAHPRAAETATPAAETFEPPAGFEARKRAT